MSDGRPSDTAREVDGRLGEPVAAVPRVLDGRYRLERVLGSGGMGTVWRGQDLRLDRPVAVKVLSGDGLSLPKAMERFGREARAVARLSHPNIVPVYDFGADDDDPYLVMQLVDGSTVADLLGNGPLAMSDVLAISSQVCDGLTAAQAAGIVHRDIKPSNLIVTAAGVVKICDFGVARLLDGADHADLTGSAVAMGSPKYMAPEQINGDPVDARTDLYGLGCSMYTMLTGRPPFSTGTPLSVAHQHMTTAPQPVTVHRPDAPPQVAALVADLLAKAPQARPADAATVRARIGEATEAPDKLSVAGPPHRPGAAAQPTPGPEPRRRRLMVGAIAAILAATVIAALIATTHAENQSAAGRLAATSGPAAGGPSPNVIPSTAATTTSGPINGGSINSPTAQAQTPPPTPAPPPQLPADPMLALRQSIQRQADAGGLQPDAVKDLNHLVDDLAKSVTSANPADETKKLKAIRDKLTNLYREGKLTVAGYSEINSRVDAVAATIG
jgi:serine/threonine-protein kinase